jgi:hypothetical protein
MSVISPDGSTGNTGVQRYDLKPEDMIVQSETAKNREMNSANARLAGEADRNFMDNLTKKQEPVKQPGFLARLLGGRPRNNSDQ